MYADLRMGISCFFTQTFLFSLKLMQKTQHVWQNRANLKVLKHLSATCLFFKTGIKRDETFN